jgi:predicted ester cyclase
MTIQALRSARKRTLAPLVLTLAAFSTSACAQDSARQDDEARQVVNRLITEVQSGGDFALFEQLFAPALIDHTPFPGYSPDKDGARAIYKTFRTGFPDFRAQVHLQVVESGRVTSFKTYRGTHLAPFMGLEPTGREIAIPIMDIVEVREGRITAHWGVPNVLVLYQQLGVTHLDQSGAPLPPADTP